VWFAAQLVARPCLDQPTLQVVPDAGPAAFGTYSPQQELVRVEEDLGPRMFRLVAVHEFAHHYWNVCHVGDRPLGRRFLRVVGEDSWTRAAQEKFADTFAWVLTGQGLASGHVERRAGWLFRNLVDTPDAGQAERLTRPGGPS